MKSSAGRGFRPLAALVLLASLWAAAADARPEASAAGLLLAKSDLPAARALARRATERNPADAEAWFLRMEAAALAADPPEEMEAALRLAEIAPGSEAALVAAARIADLATNAHILNLDLSRLRRLAQGDAPEAAFLQQALVREAVEGRIALDPAALAREAGLLTDWRLAGLFGHFANVAFDQAFAPEKEGLGGNASAERLHFDDGEFLLPDHYVAAGVHYAEAAFDATHAGDYTVRVESPGTIALFLDGKPALVKDERLATTAAVASVRVRLAAGTHQVLVKFLPSAMPFRVALRPHEAAATTPEAFTPLAATYIRGAARYWLGDEAGAVAALAELRRQQPSSLVEYLLARAWMRLGDPAPEASALLESALRRSPEALAARLALAERAMAASRYDDAYALAQAVAEQRPALTPALEIVAASAAQLGMKDEARRAHEALIAAGPSCAHLQAAARWEASAGALNRTRALEDLLANCAPHSLAYADVLAARGEHAAAATAAAQVVNRNPIDRRALETVARESALAGDGAAALRAARELVALAPNSAAYRTLERQIARGDTLLAAENNAECDGGACETERRFYAPYRTDGFEAIRRAAGRRFAGGPAVTLLDERVVRLSRTGAVSLYVHRITRVLNREGMERYGEVALAAGAELLELRTVKQDGTTVEPDFSPNKQTVSMPALAPGDAIEVEYVVRHPEGGIDEHGEAFHFTFGSLAAPTLEARFTVLSPDCGQASACDERSRLRVVSGEDAPVQSFTRSGGEQVRLWARNDIAQSTRESSPVPGDVLPTVRLVAVHAGGWEYLRDSYRERLIEATQVGAAVRAAATRLRAANADDTARRLYQLVTREIRPEHSDWAAGEVASAESTLSIYAGSRTAALVALARACGIDAELLLARAVTEPASEQPDPRVYRHPLVRLRLPSGVAIADAESTGLAFGALPPEVARDRALVAPATAAEAQRSPLFASLRDVPTADERSTATGDVRFDSAGNLSATITIRMGTSRSRQLRATLGGIAPGERRQFFQQLALRLFRGATEVEGTVIDEEDTTRPLGLRLRCRALNFAEFSGAGELEQLAPALGLRRMYGVGLRRFPLYVATPLVEVTTFQIHLPAGVRLLTLPRAFSLKTEFGEYSVGFRQMGAREFEVRRSFDIPVQVIAPGRFAAFADMALRIDEAERQRIAVEASPAPGHGSN